MYVGQENSDHYRSIGGIGAGLVEGFLKEIYNVVATSRETNRKLTTSSSLVLLDGDSASRVLLPRLSKQQSAISELSMF
jgi:hypothetical protein